MTDLRAGLAENSREFDKALGRTDYVFSATASFRFNYGSGLGILLDPCVLERPGVHASDQDVLFAVECMECWLQDDECGGLALDRTKAPGRLREIVMDYRAHHGRPEEGTERKVAECIAASLPFKRYYAENYPMSVDAVYRNIQTVAEQARCSLLGYFARTNIWPLTDEFLIPHAVEPEHLLGYWDGGAWNEWTAPKSAETKDRLWKWVHAKEVSRI